MIELLGVPFDGYGRPGHQARAAAALREAGLVERLGARDLGDLDLPPGSPERGPTSLVNDAALVVQTEQLAERLRAVLDGGGFPVVVGGDCTTLLGTARVVPAVLFVDGHEDTMPLDVSEDGEAANTELGLLLGLTGRTLIGPLAGSVGLLDPTSLAIAGPRDAAWRRPFNVGSLRDLGHWFRDADEAAADPEGCGRGAAEHLRAAADRWWLHVDLDAMDPQHFAAQGVPGDAGTPGGLTPDQLGRLLRAAYDVGGCVGMSAAIYDPEQDPDGRDAETVVELVAAVLA